MNNKKRERPFEIDADKEQKIKILKELNEVDNIKSAIHFFKNYKKYIFINRKFKRKAIKMSVGTVATLSSLALAFALINHKNETEDNTDITPIETTIEDANNEYIGPVLSQESLNEINNADKGASLDSEEFNFNETEDSTYEIDADPTMVISFPKASDTNTASDYENYYKIKDKYGLYIDKIAKESGVDSRIIIAMIALENPDGKDLTSGGTYGPMCVTTALNGETFDYGYFDENGEFKTEKITLNAYDIKGTDLYANGMYGDITVAEAIGIDLGVKAYKLNISKLKNSNSNLELPEIAILALTSYNHGYPDTIRETKDFDNLFDASYSVRYVHAGDTNSDDDEYIEDVLNKIPDEELTSPIIIIDNDGEQICFTLQRDNSLATVSAEKINISKSI